MPFPSFVLHRTIIQYMDAWHGRHEHADCGVPLKPARLRHVGGPPRASCHTPYSPTSCHLRHELRANASPAPARTHVLVASPAAVRHSTKHTTSPPTLSVMCAVLRCAALRCAALHCAVPRCAALRCAVLCAARCAAHGGSSPPIPSSPPPSRISISGIMPAPRVCFVGSEEPQPQLWLPL